MDFDDFYREHYSLVRRAMLLTFRDPSLADDVTQEAFYKALRRWTKVSQLDRPDAWTMVVALNDGRDSARRRRRHEAKARLLSPRGTTGSAEQDVADRMFVAELLESVTDRQREVLVLRYMTQMTVPEIARVLHCAEGTVKSTLHSALQKASQLAKGPEYVDD